MTPEEALSIQESLVGFNIPQMGQLQAFSANLMVTMSEAAASDCTCDPCVRIRDLMENIVPNFPPIPGLPGAC